MDSAAARSGDHGDRKTNEGVVDPVVSTLIDADSQVDPKAVGEDGLSRRDHDILAFERQWWKYAGAKEEAIKQLFGLSSTRYYQVLNALVDRPEALAADPMLVKRLRRLRSARQKARAARRLGFEIT